MAMFRLHSRVADDKRLLIRRRCGGSIQNESFDWDKTPHCYAENANVLVIISVLTYLALRVESISVTHWVHFQVYVNITL